MKKFLQYTVVFTIGFLIANFLFGYWYEKDLRESYENKTHYIHPKWEAIHSSVAYDLFFIGSSRGYCAFNPVIIDSLARRNSYNICTSSQNSIESYYILKELFRFQKPKTIVLELFLPSFNPSTDYVHVLANERYMSEQGKRELIWEGFGAEGIFNYALPVLRNRLYIEENIKKAFKPHKPEESIPSEDIWIKGYQKIETTASESEIKTAPPIYTLENSMVSDEKLIYLQKIFSLCKSHNVQLICVTVPFPPSRLSKSPKDTAHEYFSTACKNSGVPFYDFNYLKNPRFIYSDTDFSDLHHLNDKGAQKVSIQLSEILCGKTSP